MESIPALDALKMTFENPLAQKATVLLYSQSQTECTRNGKCGMEIGMAREKDQGAVLKMFLGDAVRVDIDNSLTEDYVVHGEKISAKHSQAKIGSPVKAKWTSAKDSVEKDLATMIEAPDSYYPHLLLTYINPAKKEINIFCFTATQNRTVVKSLGVEAFKVPKGNSRGIEYSSKAMKALFAQTPYFHVKIADADVMGSVDPIERRIQMLRSLGLCPPAEEK